MRHNKTRFRPSFHIVRLFPNLLTLVGLCAGLSSIRYALYGKWETAVILIIIAASIDGLDGRLARMLHSTSNFGAYLDSLCDLVNFGVAPALTLYLWKTGEARGFGWAFVLLFVVCAALRLARFNTSLDDENPRIGADRFFVGIPAPAGAGLALMPIMISFWAEENFKFSLRDNFFLFQPSFLSLYLGVVAVMMASRVPTFSAKKIAIKTKYLSPIVILLVLSIIALIIDPWLTFPLLGGLYLLSIPFSIYSHHRLKRRHNPIDS